MRFAVHHVTQYRYSQAVFLEPHLFRLCPRGGGGQRVTQYALHIDPPPAGLSESLDAENNGVYLAWFEDLTSHLTVNSSFEVETHRTNPFDFILTDLAMATLPPAYPEPERAALAPYVAAQNKDRSVYSFAKAAAQEVEWQTVPFLTALNRKLHTHLEHTTREDGEPQSADMTLAIRSGACRDAAVVFIEACRAMGLAARFVSGYELIAARREKAYMHAWAEVYLPGGGWRGYDPARGLAAAENHIALASGLTPQLAAPIAGSYRGDGVRSEMEYEIHVSELAALQQQQQQ
jgi:transglutaminase-like putative cysteine protease